MLQSIYGEENVVDFGDVDIMDGFVSTLQIRLFATESPDIQIGVLDVCFKEEKQEKNLKFFVFFKKRHFYHRVILNSLLH